MTMTTLSDKKYFFFYINTNKNKIEKRRINLNIFLSFKYDLTDLG